MAYPQSDYQSVLDSHQKIISHFRCVDAAGNLAWPKSIWMSIRHKTDDDRYFLELPRREAIVESGKTFDMTVFDLEELRRSFVMHREAMILLKGKRK